MNQKITLRLGCAIVGLVEDDETLAVVTKNGERIEADVIVGADGKPMIDTLQVPLIRF